ncbi:uncharacterized protein LOC134192428 [Corticium candelabrum]|uniref:uncharacterized protein LOC134192428 n=1 Tax=Corticium candelabrum TaxID=121492 RepID=UPI002E2614F5|nr:uncharacterized protein LOC134192428 [Corticium candelabrum]
MASTALHVRPPPHRLDDNKPPSSRFRIACDARLSGNVRSTFTNDFPAHDPTLSRRDPMKEPEPAHIMHSDAASQQRGESITRETYNAHAVNRPHFKSSTDGYATNFKMHADKSIARKFNFRTTHGDEFRSRDLNAARQSMNEAFSSLKSCFPQGDESKEKTTRSEYGNSFRGEAGNVAVSTQNRWNVQNTICGDSRTQKGQFVTTSSRVHNAQLHHGFHCPSPIYPVPPMDVSSVPQGDKHKAECPASMQKTSYRVNDVPRDFQCYSKSKARAHIGATTFVQGVSDRGGMRTTAGVDYPAIQGGRQSPQAPPYRNYSSLPEGDNDSKRQIARLLDTTNREFHPKLAPGHYHAYHVSGANLRTHSNVHLGMARGKQFYNTSMNGSYPSYNMGQRFMAQPPTKVNIPLKLGYAFGQTTHQVSYSQHPHNRLRHSDPGVYHKIKQPHWKMEATNRATFDTEHTTQFIPKPYAPKQHIDSGSLHRSSLPLGSKLCPGEFLHY